MRLHLMPAIVALGLRTTSLNKLEDQTSGLSQGLNTDPIQATMRTRNI